MLKTISTDKLQRLRKSAAGFLLIDVTSKESFDKDHIPGARSVPLEAPDFVGAVAEKASGSRTRKIVVYCAGPGCDASTRAAVKLVADGFTTVFEYEGGLAEWNESRRAATARAVKSN